MFRPAIALPALAELAPTVDSLEYLALTPAGQDCGCPSIEDFREAERTAAIYHIRSTLLSARPRRVQILAYDDQENRLLLAPYAEETPAVTLQSSAAAPARCPRVNDLTYP